MKRDIIPAILPSNFDDLYGHVEAVKDAVGLVQVDVCDGKFVPQPSFPYSAGEKEFAKIVAADEGLPFWQDVDYEVDLMVLKPGADAKRWVEAGAKRLIFHIESEGVKEAIEMLKKEFKYTKEDDILEVGVAINITTPVEALKDFVEDVIFVQCMGIARIGFQHEPFDVRVIEKIKEIKKIYPDMIVSVDGGVDLDNAKELVDAGATRLVSGHAIFQGDAEPHDAVKMFRDIIKG